MQELQYIGQILDGARRLPEPVARAVATEPWLSPQYRMPCIVLLIVLLTALVAEWVYREIRSVQSLTYHAA